MIKLLMGFLPQADIIYVALFVALGAFALYERHHLIAEGEQKVLTALAASTAKLTAQNNAALAKQAADDAATLKSVQDGYDAALKTSLASSSALARRLRDYEAGRGKTAVPSDPTAPGKPDGGAAVAISVDIAVAGVIDAAGHDAQQVIGLQQYISGVCLR